jgi:hypothetical protein
MCPSPVSILSQLNPVHTSYPTSWISILILSFQLHLGLPSGLFPSGLHTNTLYTPLSSPAELHAPPISFSILSPAQYWVRSTDYEAPHYEVFSPDLLTREKPGVHCIGGRVSRRAGLESWHRTWKMNIPTHRYHFVTVMPVQIRSLPQGRLTFSVSTHNLILISMIESVAIYTGCSKSVHLMITIQKVTSNVQNVFSPVSRARGDTRPTLTPSVIPNSNYVIMVSDWNCLK